MNLDRHRVACGVMPLLRPKALLALLLAPTCASFGLQHQTASDRPFTVRDSIEMTTFSDPYQRSQDAKCKVSPNGRYFFVITTKGNLDSNQLHSTLWLYSTERVHAFLASTKAVAPKPLLLWQDDAVPKAQQFDSYGSLITKAQWNADSKAILFLAETGDGVRRLYSLHIQSRRIVLLSTPNAEVEDFTESAGTTVYAVKTATNGASQRTSPFSDTKISTALTGRTLFNIFDPSHFPPEGSIYPSGDLWALFRGRHIPLGQATESAVWHYPAAAMALFHLALSPDGQRLIAAEPSSRIEASWSHFALRSSEFSFDQLPRTEARAAGDWSWPWEYVYVDLKRNSAIPIINAPNAFIAGYADTVLAAWSPDSSRALLTNSFLPLLSNSDMMRQALPCVAAVFMVATHGIQCVAYVRDPQTRLTNASFGTAPDQIQLTWVHNGIPLKETYRSEAGRWILTGKETKPADKSGPMVVSVRQDLNQPPALWATDSRTGKSKELWNPNPQLTSLEIGQASVFRWREASGYEWTAGLLKPHGYKPGHRYPLVIQTHGFDQHEFLVDGSYTTGFAAQPLAADGIMVLQMEDRRNRHLKPVSEEATSFAIGCAAAVQQLTTDGLINPSEVGIIGFSRASWYVETTLEMYPKLFKAATMIDGVDQGYVSDILLCPGLPSCKNDHLAANGGPPFGKELFHWLAVAPSFNLDKLQTPLRIEAIRWYSVLEEWEIYSSLYQQGKPVDLIYIPHGQHILQQPRQRLASQQGNVDWFRFWLQGYEAPDPEKKAEYLRWEHLREATTVSMLRPAGQKTR